MGSEVQRVRSEFHAPSYGLLFLTPSRSASKGKATKRLCLILSGGGTREVRITYLATFHSSKRLPADVDKRFFYPVHPARDETPDHRYPAFVACSSERASASWISLRKSAALVFTSPQEEVRMQLNRGSSLVPIHANFFFLFSHSGREM